MNHSCRNLVVLSPNWLGDAVMALPALADVRRHFAGARLTVAARAPVVALFRMVEGVDDVLVLPGRGGLAALTSWTQDVAALEGGGRLFAIVGDGPAMSARLVRRTSSTTWTSEDLFETWVEPLVHAERPRRFVF